MPSLGLVRPEALPLIAVVGTLVLLAAWSEARRRRAVARFAGRGAELASVSPGRRRAKLALALAGAALAVASLAGPYVDVVRRQVVQSGVDLVVALDVSQSMAVRDVEPDRLRAGKEFVRRLGDGLTQSRVALVLFAGDGIERYPPTSDPSVLGRALDSVSGAFKPRGGSSLRAAVDSALLAFSSEARESARRKAVILISDGEDTLGQASDVDVLRQRSVKLFTVGVGTATGGPIPVYDRSGTFAGYLRRSSGEQIVSRMDEDALRSLADRTDGRYWHLAPGFATVNEVATELRRLDATRLGEVDGGSVPDDRYQPLLALAIVALVIDGLLDDRRGMPRPRWLRAPAGAGRGWRVARPALPRAPTVFGIIAALALGACGAPPATEGDRLYAAGDAKGALERYRAALADRPAVPELHVNAGNALHQVGQYEPALGEYAFGVREGAPSVRAVAAYQRGNTLFRMGKLDEAREAYKSALRLDPRDRDAKFNIEVIDALLTTTEARSGEGAQQPGQSARPNPGQGQSDQNGQRSGPQDQRRPPQAAPQGAQGAEGPQSAGPPQSDAERTGPSLADALRDFRSQLTAEEALRLLDALRNDQRGLQILLEGQQPQRGPGQQPQDPTY